MRLEVLASPELEERAAAIIAEAKPRTLALSGGSTPAGMFRCLAKADIAWHDVSLFQVDERIAPREERNLTLIDRELLANIDGTGPTVHAMPVDDDDPDAASRRYADELETICGHPPVLDVVHIGLGEDGHIASIVPNDPVLDIRDRSVAVTKPYAGVRRLTLTFPVLDAARLVVMLVKGSSKVSALAGMLSGGLSIPAARLGASDVLVLADPDASGSG